MGLARAGGNRRMDEPFVSVVMSVYNGAAHLDATIRSILEQQGVTLEFVIVDDGSTDESGAILQRYATIDPRIVLLQQENTGLTRALIRACEQARGRYIARQDAGDRSFPGRLVKQAAYLDAYPDVMLVSCWTRYIGPADEELWLESRQDTPAQATRRLRANSREELRGISSHSSAMFRRADYIQVGGYRPQFWLAQDLDLWTRLTDSGEVAIVPECLCEYRFEPNAISGRYAREQAYLTDLIIEMRKRRVAGLEETSLLAEADGIRPDTKAPVSHSASSGLYFLGKVLMDRGDRRGLVYLRQVLANDPFHARARCWLAWYAVAALLHRRPREFNETF